MLRPEIPEKLRLWDYLVPFVGPLNGALEIEVVIDLLNGGLVRETVGELERAEARLDQSGVVMDAGMSVVIFIFGAVCARAVAITSTRQK
jgi:hypothetical protein